MDPRQRILFAQVIINLHEIADENRFTEDQNDALDEQIFEMGKMLGFKHDEIQHLWEEGVARYDR
jgi:hypothetical protein